MSGFKEYKTLALNRKLHSKKVSEKLNEVANDGWLLVTSYTNDISVVFVFEERLLK